MKELKEMTLDELKALEEQIKIAKVNLKDSVKAEKAGIEQTHIDACNSAISDRTLAKSTNVVVLYKGNEVTATVVTEPSVSRTSINCTSDLFDGKTDDNGEKRRYIDKKNFVRVA